MITDLTTDMAPWLIVDRMLADANGETHFVRARLPDEGARTDAHGIARVLGSITLSSEAVSLRCMPEGMDIQHRAPERRLVAVLSGRMEVTVSDGETRSWGAGEILLATDTGTGKGHRTRAVDGPVTVVVVQIGDDVDLDAWTVPARASAG
ncbi:MAG: hypothetical protein JWR80_8153 [Bradyrhizobium sp.]|nr:hypothetical protein [Bradyrhizobium sp.]